MGSFRGAAYLAIAAVLFLNMVATSDAVMKAANFGTWTPKGVAYSRDGTEVALTLQDPAEPYAGVASKKSILYASTGIYMLLKGGDSAGTVTTFYALPGGWLQSRFTEASRFRVDLVAGTSIFMQLSSSGNKHCEFDFEFLGNSSGEPYILHTNIFVDGVGGREIQIRLWFDPTIKYHYYNLQWSADVVIFFIDNTPIRMFGNYESLKLPVHPTQGPFLYPKNCPMNMYLSIWDGSSWATQGGRVKLNWASAPFTAHYKRIKFDGCPATMGNPASIAACQQSTYAKSGARVDGSRRKKLRWVKQNYLHYYYCTDVHRYPVPPPECKYNVL